MLNQNARLALSALFTSPFFNRLTFWLGVEEKLGGTSSAGFFRKKFRGLSSNVIGSAGMTGKSSGDGKCVMPNVCHSTISVFSMFS